MKYLFITSIVPYPPHRGDKLRIFNVIKSIAKRNEVKVVSFVRNDNERENAQKYKDLGYDIITVDLPRFKGLLNLVNSLFSLAPLQVSFFYSREMQKIISSLTSQVNYDVVYFHLFNMAQYYKCVKNPTSVKVYDITDASVIYLKKYLEILKFGFSKIFYTIEKMLIANYESISSKFDINFLCSQIDLEHYKKKGINSLFKLYSNGFDSSLFIPKDTSIEKGRIIFAGSMPYFPNKDAALFFAKEVFPLILKKRPDAKFYIVGQDPPNELLSLQSTNIIVTGFVEDIKLEYLKSEVNVAPIRFGTGTQNKVIEALALGIPTVASSICVAGFDEKIKEYIYTAENPEEYAEKVLYILNNPAVRKEKMPECIKSITSIMNWDTITMEIEEILSDLRNKKSTL